MNTKTLHFSIGPVQGFVAQARRTQDFWTGSFLLSWLVGQALNEVIASSGTVIFPDIEGDLLMTAVSNPSKSREIPVVATLPNRFMAKVPQSFDPKKCQQAILNEWSNIAEIVYEKYLLPVEEFGNGTREIWERQIGGFWDITWAIGEGAKVLDRRKNWRSFVPTVEPGDKCSLMGNMQELSGYLPSVSSAERNKQNSFWQAVGERVGFHLKDKERLCAIAFLKRMFPQVSQEAIFGTVPSSYPSTPSLAVTHWLDLVSQAQPEQCREFAAKASALGLISESRVKLIHNLKRTRLDLNDFFDLDPNCFFSSSLENDNLWLSSGNHSDLRRELRKLLSKFIASPSPFYALLLMDGDRMGRLLAENEGLGSKISKALGEFSRAVPGIVLENNGVCVYAGGDDVLAMFPLEDALKASIDLQKEYEAVFEHAYENEPGLKFMDEATISGAIIYSHQNTPLQVVYRQAHKTLKEDAKEANGRNSLAISVLKSSGPNLSWSAPWAVIKSGDPSLIDELVEAFSTKDGTQYSSSFFYNLRQRFDMLAGSEKDILDLTQISQVLTAEYLKSRKHDDNTGNKGCSIEQARKNVKDLLQVCRSSKNCGGKVCWENTLKLDGAMLVKFLATKGAE